MTLILVMKVFVNKNNKFNNIEFVYIRKYKIVCNYKIINCL